MIPKSRNLVRELLSTMTDNLAAGGDPLGFREAYWTDWAQGLGLPRQGGDLIFTARMYQMLPYVIQTTKLVDKTRSVFSNPLLAKAAKLGNRLAGEKVLRRLAGQEQDIAQRGQRALRGIAKALSLAGSPPSYLYEDEPYTGALPYDLGLLESFHPHAAKVAQALDKAQASRIIGTDPHTVFMLSKALPAHAPGFATQVEHYSETLARQADQLAAAAGPPPVKAVVVHDSCQMARDLGLVDQVRRVVEALGIEVKEPANRGKDTACCGGPIEFAFGELSDRISHMRASELKEQGDDAVVACPICLINLAKHESELGLKVWDLGELLGAGLGAGD